ncbi:MAG: calcium/sodium antiporter [Phycisphaeraceae bacterium]|nr:calcium/sodium antiporter [Phycisphaeraceae bacterium]
MKDFLLFAAGLGMLLVGGRVLVSAAVDIAQRFGVPTLLIGLTLVAWGTSAPELAFNLTSAIKGKPDLVLGNVVGASICNMGLVLGVAALIAPLAVEAQIVRREIPLMIGMFVLMLATSLSVDLQHAAGGRLEPLILIAAFGAYSAVAIRAGLRSRTVDKPLEIQTSENSIVGRVRPLWMALVLAIVGMALLSVGGSIASDAAGGIAVGLGLSPRVVGLTVVAIGTTMPELITSIIAVRKGQADLAVGNVAGSCLFNIGAIFAVCGLVAPAPPAPDALPSIVAMCVLGLMLIPMSRTHNRHISRIEGAVLILVQVSFITYELLRK